MFGGYTDKPKAEIHGVIHITGGGIPGKLGRVLKPSGFGATLDNLFEPCKLMLYAQEKGNVSDEEAYRTWNMGNGMLIITPEPEKAIAVAKQYGIEAKVCGKITSEKGIKIQSKGTNKKNSLLCTEFQTSI
jgi:phosphoribosylformylglycinamidine cyclo-ligase